jgi:hypothetical protein
LRWILAKLVTGIGWTLEPAEALAKLKERTLCVYTPQDEMLPPAVSAFRAVEKRSSVFPEFHRVINLQLKPTEVEDGHNAPLRNYRDAFGNSPTNRIVDFILGKEVFPIKNHNFVRPGQTLFPV